eukprot:TRINITY_DN19182_c0_g1_i1.p1 TRINITY_DN19182_c0_g1~~TRINITY_DN19182_c0_g1_i1.p1  ORF type:complete len:626 (+),score=162.06 TRINITY_DN19182_c0_g1_i1:66-1943(+)
MADRQRLLLCAVAGWMVAFTLFLFIVAGFGFDAPTAADRPTPTVGDRPSQPAAVSITVAKTDQAGVSLPPVAQPFRPVSLQQLPADTPKPSAEQEPEPEPVRQEPTAGPSPAAPVPPPHPVTVPPGVDPAILNSPADALAPRDPPDPPTAAECAAHRASFIPEHKALLSFVNLSAEPKWQLKNHWADGDAFCGVHQLYHVTSGGVLWLARGSGLKAARTLQVQTVTLFNCAEQPADPCPDVQMHARLVGPTIVGADVVRRAGSCAFDVSYVVYEPGTYSLEIKHVHFNGGSENWRDPLSLGVDRSRVRGPNGEKWYAKHRVCAKQRHVWKGPFQITATGQRLVDAQAVTPRCEGGSDSRGRWVPFWPQMCSQPQPYCGGNPWWLADAYGFNRELLWAPTSCHYKYYSPPHGPSHQCMERRGVLGIIGDSIAREYVQNCKVFRMGSGGLACEHWHMIINGEFYSQSYVHDVTKVIIDKLHADKPVALAANFGIMHMIGMRNDSDWDYFMGHFAAEWAKRPPSFPLRKIWLGPPTIHYATRGMSQQRTQRWEQITLKHLEPLGWERLQAHPVTRMREEGSWDGLHNSAEKGRKQSKVRNKKVKEFKWNGGVSHTLWNVLLNMLCPRG